MDIFIINSEKSREVSEDLLAQYTYKAFRNNSQKLMHQFSYLMLDRILKDFYKIENRAIVHSAGKPELVSNEKQISISHSGGFIALAFSDYECGIDIEKITKRDYKKISERMGFVSKSLKDFYCNWTKYEAEYKLKDKIESIYQFEIPEYVTTAVCKNANEKYEVYYSL